MTRHSRPEGRPQCVGTHRNPTPEQLPGDINEECAVHLAEEAFATGNPASCATHNLVAVPDLVIVENAANGVGAVNTWQLRRADGRSVSMYRIRAVER